MSQHSDTQLIKKLNQGDHSAFREVYDKYHKSVYGIVFKYLKDPSRAEDAVHDVFIKLWNYRKQLDSTQSLKGFLFTAAKNHVLNMIRDKKRDDEKIKSYSRVKSGASNEVISHLTLKNYKKVFRYFLSQLTDRKREIFEMKMQEGISNKTIAEQLGISVNTVKSQYYKASKFIKEQLNQHTEITIE